LLAPTLIARIPDAIAGTAIVVVARPVTGSYSAAGLAAGAFGAGTWCRRRRPGRDWTGWASAGCCPCWRPGSPLR
jgi:hypothetical protein